MSVMCLHTYHSNNNAYVIAITYNYVYFVIIPASKIVRHLYNEDQHHCFNTELLNFIWPWDHAFDDYVGVVNFHAKYVNSSN